MGKRTCAGEPSKGRGRALGWVIPGALLAIAAVAHSSCDATRSDCPITDWPAWQHEQVQLLEKAGFNPESLKPIVKGTEEAADRCRGYFEQDPIAGICTKNLRAFARALWLPDQPSHSLGMELTDRAYFATLPDPDILELPRELHDQRFLKLLDANTPAALDAATAYLDGVNAGIRPKELAWKYFIYDSQHLPTPDGTKSYGRFFVFVPGPSFDRYLQFGLRDDPKNPVPNSVSMVTMQKTDPGTGERRRVPRAYLKDLWRVRDGGKITISTRLDERGKLENCYACHKQALLPIEPAPATFDAARWGATVQEINARMSSYGETEYVGLNQSAYGPGLGPLDSPLRTDAFLRSCAGDQVPPARLDRLKDAMSCARCHDGVIQARLDYPTLRRPLPVGGTLVSHYVVTHRKMPPGADLTDGEREALVRCLDAEYYRGFGGQPGLLSAWLTQPGCAASER
jgi:hypothetical protein